MDRPVTRRGRAPRLTLPDPTEAQVQHACLELLELMHIPVYRVGQRDARGTQDAGVSDLIVLSPKHGVLFVEMKGPKGEQSAAQRAFESAVVAARGRYLVVRSTGDLIRLLQHGEPAR